MKTDAVIPRTLWPAMRSAQIGVQIRAWVTHDGSSGYLDDGTVGTRLRRCVVECRRERAV